MQQWKEIEDHPGYYISNEGKIKSIKGNGHPNSNGERILRSQKINSGYLQVILSSPLKIKKVFVHRLVAKHFIENPFNYPTVDHLDRDKENNFATNLKWASYEENNLNRF